MLVLTRKEGEGFKIGRDLAAIAAGEFIEVVAVEVDPMGRKTRIGIAAPGDVKIYREEILDDWCDEVGVVKELEPTRSPFLPPIVIDDVPADTVGGTY